MARIARAQTNIGESRVGISLGAAAAAGRGASEIGSTISSVGRASQQSNQLGLARQVATTPGPKSNQLGMGRQISALVDAEGKRIFNESKRAHQSATLLNKTTAATEQFIGAQQQRYSQVTDENGNPTFETLHKDVEQIGNDIIEKTASTIIDPEVAQAFRGKFGNYIANQKVSALKKARNQQVQFAKSSLDNGLAKLVNQATKDEFAQIGGYEQQGLESLRSALKGGVISKEQFDENSKAFSLMVRKGALQNLVKTDRIGATQVLTSSTPEQLGIPAEEKAVLDVTLAAGLASDVQQSVKANEVATMDNLAEESNLISTVEDRIESDAIREDELLELQGSIDDKSFSSLKKKFIKQTKKESDKRERIGQTLDKVSRGEFIGDMTKGQIDETYDFMIKQVSDKIQGPLPLHQEARVAATLNTPVADFGKKVSHMTKYGDVSNAEEVIGSYTYIRDKESPALDSGFNNKDRAILEYAEMLYEKGGLQPGAALTRARESVLESDEPVRTMRQSEFKADSDFKGKNIVETAASDLEGAESTFGFNRITQDSANTYKQLAREYYIETGDMSAAKKTAQAHMNRTHGVTSVGASDKYMFAPPERVFPKVDSQVINTILIDEVSRLYNTQYTQDDLTLTSDKDTFNITGQPTWLVAVETDGITVPLEDSRTGQPLRWSPAGDPRFSAETNKDPFAEAKAANEELRAAGGRGEAFDIIGAADPLATFGGN